MASQRPLGRAIGFGLAAVILFTTFAIGGALTWVSAVSEICLWGLGAIWFMRGGSQPIDRRSRWVVIGLLSYLGLQLVPLPPPLLAVLSPGAAEIDRRTAAAIEPEPSPAPGIQPIAPFEDGKVPVAERMRIHDFAAGSGGWFPTGWRSIALYPFAAHTDLLRTLAFVLALWLAATLPVPLRLFRSVVMVGIAAAAFALVQFVTWNGHILWFFDPYDVGPLGDYPRMIGPFANPDHFAVFLAMLLPAGGALLIESRRPSAGRSRGVIAPFALGIGLTVMVAALIGSASRGGILVALLGAVASWWNTVAMQGRDTVPPPRRRNNRLERARRFFNRVAPAAVTAAIVLGGFLYAGPRARSTLDARLAATNASDWGFRMAMVEQSLPMIRDFPLVGVGAGCWREVFRRYERYPVVGYRPNHAHNDYVEWCAEVGFVGLALTLATIWTFARRVRANRAVPPLVRAGILGGLVAIGVHEIFDFGLRTPANALVLAVLLGLLVNPRWPERGVERDAAPPGLPGLAAVVAVFAALTLVSIRQFREFWQWASVHAGAPSLWLAPSDAETWADLGALLQRSGLRYQPPTAECLRAALRLRPTSERALWHLSRSATSYPVKLRALEAALDLDPTRAEWRVEYARLLDALGRGDEAIVALEEAVYRDPRLGRSHRYLTPEGRGIGEHVREAAERGLRRALADRPSDPLLLNEVATFYDRFGLFEQAAEMWLRAAEASGDRGGYGRPAGLSYARLGDATRAEEVLMSAIGAEPAEADGYRLLAMAVYRPLRKFAEAKKTLERGIRRSTNPASLYAALYELEREQGDTKAALQALAKAADLNRRDADSQFRLGVAYLEAGDDHRARTAFDRAIAVDDARAAFHYYKGMAAERLYDLGEALESYRRAITLEPRNDAYVEAAKRVEAAFEDSRRDRPVGTD